MKKQIIELLQQCGLEQYKEVIEQGIKPSIRLKPKRVKQEKTIPIGSSKMGGRPDLPPSIDWPVWSAKEEHQLSFLCQVNLSELPEMPLSLERTVPQSGMLYFFFASTNEAIYEEDWFPTQKDACRVLFYNGDASILRRTNYPKKMKKEGCFPACSLMTLIEWDIPSSEWIALEEEEQDFWVKWEDFNKKHQLNFVSDTDETYFRPVHKLFGHVDAIQYEMEREWVHLLTVDTCEELKMDWGDTGHVVFWVPEKDLKKWLFTNVLAEMECS